MSAVTPAMIKELKERTGAGMMDCKNSLIETGGDLDKAIVILREKGLAAAAKKAGRIAAEGITHVMVSGDGKRGAVVEVNCETDFVAKNDTFKQFVEEVCKQALTTGAKDIDSFLAEPWALDNSVTVADAVSGKVATIGEKISIRRFGVLEAGSNCFFSTYIHGGGRISVLLEMEGERNDTSVEAAKNLSMQIAAMFPKYVAQSDLPAEYIASEREIILAQTMNEEAQNENKKPQNVVEKMVDGRLKKQMKEICLLDQEYIKDASMNCAQYLENVSKEAGSKISVKRFICYERGEGIEKKEDNFAEEVAKMSSK